MNLGKPIKVVEIATPAVGPLTVTSTPDDAGLIPLPSDWPRRTPAQVPAVPAEPARRDQARHG